MGESSAHCVVHLPTYMYTVCHCMKPTCTCTLYEAYMYMAMCSATEAYLGSVSAGFLERQDSVHVVLVHVHGPAQVGLAGLEDGVNGREIDREGGWVLPGERETYKYMFNHTHNSEGLEARLLVKSPYTCTCFNER